LSFTASGEPVGATPDDDSGYGGFAFTGASPATTTIIGAGALVAGLALLGVRRRRRPGAAA
jgi:LPXTG-motif cell wall-anchored protein